MTSNQAFPQKLDDDDDLFLMTKLPLQRTGLLFVVWVSLQSQAARGPNIKVSNKYGDKASARDWFTITIEDQPQVIGECTHLKEQDVQLAKKWVLLNKGELHRMWEDDVDVFDADIKQV